MNPSVARFGQDVQNLYKNNRMVVFLCGPSIQEPINSASARLRKRLLDALTSEQFEVVLGEDDGLENTRLTVTGGYAHDNELEFIRRECSAIVLVADSVGSFCELGLFVHWCARLQEKNTCDLILIANEQYKGHKSYFNEGPARAADDFGRTLFVDFDAVDIEPILKRLRGRRSTYFYDGRGRPAEGNSP